MKRNGDTEFQFQQPPDYTKELVNTRLTSLELCAGAGGQALGLEMSGFQHVGLVEIDPHACKTLRFNRPEWNVMQEDLNHFDARRFRGVDLLAAGLPCPPFSVAGKQLGALDERNLFPAALRVIEEVAPQAVIIENVRGFLDAVFEDYRNRLQGQLAGLGYKSDFRLLNASEYGVPQLRPRVVIVALRKQLFPFFSWPEPQPRPKSVGETLYEMMASRGWPGARAWSERANLIAPTVVGGSKKHGGPDLGPTRARKAWASLGVDGIGIADEPPDQHFQGILPKLTVEMVARIQGFPPEWKFAGRKTNAYRQVGNAFPPPVAKAVSSRVRAALEAVGAKKAAG